MTSEALLNMGLCKEPVHVMHLMLTRKQCNSKRYDLGERREEAGSTRDLRSNDLSK